MDTAVYSVTTSAALSWAADVVHGDVRPYVFLGVETDQNEYTVEYILAVGDSMPSDGTLSGNVSVYSVSGSGRSVVVSRDNVDLFYL